MPLLHGDGNVTLYTGEEWKAKQEADKKKKKEAAWAKNLSTHVFVGLTLLLVPILLLALLNKPGGRPRPGPGSPPIGSVAFYQNCNVRARQSERSRILATLGAGRWYEVLAVSGRWIKVRGNYGDAFGVGWSGCVSRRLKYHPHKIVKKHPNYDRYGRFASFAVGCKVREQPFAEAEVVGWAEPGVRYRLEEQGGRWVKIVSRRNDEWIDGWADCRGRVIH